VDLDGTLAVYDGWKDGLIGEPVPEMLFRVRKWLADGVMVRVVTARAGMPDEAAKVRAWLDSHELQAVAVTDRKDFAMIELWDDRAVAVEQNTGRVLGGGRRP
jgi:hypothetical protein